MKQRFDGTLPAVMLAALLAAGLAAPAWGGCVGDTNGDSIVNVDDLVNVILDWGTNGAANGGDVDGSGLVNVDDLVTVILAWGPCPGGQCPPGGPANDCCANATVVTGAVVLGFDTTNANTDGPDDVTNPCMSASADSQIWKDVWYRFDASADALLTISTCAAAPFDTKIIAYATEDCGDLVANTIECNEDCDAADTASELTIAVASGQSYLIRLGGFSINANEEDAEFGAGMITFSVGPINDACDTAIDVPVGTSVVQNLCAASDEADLPDCGNGPATSGTLWFTTTGDGTTYNVSLCDTFDFNWDSRLTVLCSTHGATACELPFCDLDSGLFEPIDGCGAGGLNEEISFCTAPGRVYLILVHADAGCGDFTLSVDSVGTGCGAPACNPDTGRCCRVNEVCDAGVTQFDCESTGGIWALDEDCTGGCPTGGCCLGENPCQENIVEADCVDLGGVFVDGGTCATLPCPVNDACESPLDLGGGTVSMAFDNTLATAGPDGAPTVTCDKFGDTPGVRKDLWYLWTADEDGTVRFDTCAGGLDTKMALYVDAGCPVLDMSEIGCNDDDGNNEPVPLCMPPGGTASAIVLSVTSGTTYRIRVGSWGTDDNQGPDGASTLNVTVLEP